MATRPPKPERRRFPRRSVEELLDAARHNEARAFARFERKAAAVEKYEGLKRVRERKLDTRRKIIAGALALEHSKLDLAFAAALWDVLDRYVVKGTERALFGLPPLNPDHAPSGRPTPSSG
jgi:hypothetical protein